ncbi:MAG: hypothetical protein J7L71_02335, partial [Spirochaetaceae bacterium]|nr:hypothetical protein [Spirochaetaceae bacterium]
MVIFKNRLYSDIKGAINYLEEYARRIIGKFKVIRDIDNKVYPFYVPGADMKYPALWIRDTFFMVEADLIPADEVREIGELILSKQNEKIIILENGLTIPSWSIPDHINFDGTPVYFPGTYNSGKNQGDGSYGFFPPHDNQYFIIELVNWYIEKTENYNFLGSKVKGITVLERLKKSFESYNIDEKTQLCLSDKKRFTVDWGFCDAVCKSGYLLFPSIMRYKSAVILSS